MFVVVAGVQLVVYQRQSDERLLRTTLPEDLVEDVLDWDHVNFNVNGEAVWRILARRMIGAEDSDEIKLESVRIERMQSSILANRGVWRTDEDNLELSDTVRIFIEDERGATLRLNAEHVVVFHAETDGYGFKANGNPARFVHEDGGAVADGPRARGQARYMEYSEKDDLLLLVGNAEIEDADGYFGGEQLRYSINRD